MKQSTLILVFNNNNQILLCMKKRGFGEGKYNGAGGKVEANETIAEGACRELFEETNISATPDTLQNRGLLHFYFHSNPDWNQDVHLFTLHNYTGSFEETEEMKGEWFLLNDIPYSQMWEDDAIWLPRILTEDTFIEYNTYFDEQGKIYKMEKLT